MASRGPSRGWYGVAVGIFLLFSAGGPIVFVFTLIGGISAGQQFKVPGTTTFAAEEAGTYTLWNEVSTMYEGRSYAPGRALPDGMRVRITAADGGAELPLTPDQSAMEQGTGGERRSIGTFEAPRAGRYVIDVKGDFAERIFFVRKALLGRILGSVLALVLSTLFGIFGGAALAIVTFIRRHRAAQTKAPAAAV